MKASYQIRTFRTGIKAGLVASLIAVLVLILCVIAGVPQEWQIIGVLLIGMSIIFAAAAWLTVQGRYQITAEEIRFRFFGITYRKVGFTEYSRIVITNATFHVKTSGGLAGFMPLIDKERTIKNGNTVCFPYFVAVTEDFPMEKIRSGMDAADVYHQNWYQASPVGICYHNALKELIDVKKVTIYIQKDVYLHYQDLFQAYGNAALIVE